MIAELPPLVSDAGALAAILIAVAGVATLPPVRRQWTIRVTEPNRARRREDLALELAPLAKRLDDHMAAEEGQRDADHADRAKQREQLAETLGSIEARLESGHRWMAKTDDRLDSLGREIAAMHHRALSSGQ